MDKFYIGLNQPSDAKHFERCCVSVRRLLPRKAPIKCPDVFVDSAAFTELNMFGRYKFSTLDYANELYRLYTDGVVNITVAASQDYMCEPFILKKTGLTVEEHQRRTIVRYDSLRKHLTRLFNGNIPFHVLPVIQGFRPDEYGRHIDMYGDRLTEGMWVGVGSVCKRNARPVEVAYVLGVIKKKRPDLLLHGFGVKKTALESPLIRNMIHTADSQAWSFTARMAKELQTWKVAKAYQEKIENHERPMKLFWS